MKEKDKRKQTIKISVFITSIFVILLSGTYAFINVTLAGTRRQVITAGNLSLELVEDSEIILENAMPMYDEVGILQNAFNFRLVNNSPLTSDYTVKLVDITDSNVEKLDLSIIRYGLTKDGVVTVGSLSELENLVIDIGTIGGNETIEYSLRLWIDSRVEENDLISGKSLKYSIDVEAVQRNEYSDQSGANIPVVATGMIPVIYNEETGNWEKIDTTEKWYDYNEQWWANAVTVVENGIHSRNYYMDAESGTPIPIEDINTMWVWIPRYAYKATNLNINYAGGTVNLPGEIEINFIKSDAVVASDSDYLIPEGFLFGDRNIGGFWMAKFKVSSKEGCVAADKSVGTGCDLTNLTPQIIPNVPSWRGTRVSTSYMISRQLQDKDHANIYGFDSLSATLDIHMLKNSEWGIVAMLSQSKFGKYGNVNYEGANKEIYQNKSSNFITGMSSGAPSGVTTSDNVSYDTFDKGYGASTTGNIYGVYDMASDSLEYVMGNYNQISGRYTYNNSGFCGTLSEGPTIVSNCRELPETKYYDLYISTNVKDGYKRGDATYETRGWYNDDVSFVQSLNPWFVRGGKGVFGSGTAYGGSSSSWSFRLSLIV